MISGKSRLVAIVAVAAFHFVTSLGIWVRIMHRYEAHNAIGIGGNTSKPKEEFASGENVSNSDDALAGAVLICKIPHKRLLRPK